MARSPPGVRAVLLALAVSGVVSMPFPRSARSWHPTAFVELVFIARPISLTLGPRPFSTE